MEYSNLYLYRIFGLKNKVEIAFSKWSIEKLKIFIMLRSNFFTFLWYKAAALTPILGKEMNEARINGWVVFVCCSTSKERPFPTIKITQLLARDRQFLPNLYDYPKSFKPGPYGNWDQFYAHTPFWVGFFRTLHYIFSLFSSSKEGLKSKNQIFKKSVFQLWFRFSSENHAIFSMVEI